MAKGGSNSIDFFISLVPLAQTVIWVAALISIAMLLRRQIGQIATHLTNRIGAGDKVVTPWFSIERVKASEQVATEVESSIRAALEEKLGPEGGEKESANNHSTLADEIIERVRETTFITIDNRPADPMRGRVWSVPYTEFDSVGLLLRYIWLETNLFPVNSYGINWIIQNDTTGATLREIGSRFAQAKLGTRWDERKLSDVGISVGDQILVRKI